MIWIMLVKGKKMTLMILARMVGDLDHVGKREENEPCQAGMSVKEKKMSLARMVGDLDHVGKGEDNDPCQGGR